MFAKAEGLNAFYLSRETLREENDYKLDAKNESRDIYNVSELIYELGIEILIQINCKKGKDKISFVIETDWAKKTLQNWGNRHVHFSFGLDSTQIQKLESEIKKDEEKLDIRKKNKRDLLKKIEQLKEKVKD